MSRVALPVPLTTRPIPTTETLDPIAMRRLVAELSRQLELALQRIEVLELRSVVRDGIARPPNTVGQLALEGGAVYIATGRNVTDWQIVSPIQAQYPPIATLITNLTAMTPGVTRYIRVGNVVVMGGSMQLHPTAPGAFEGQITLPIPSNLTARAQAGGTFMSPDLTVQGSIYPDSANDTLRFSGVSTVSVNKDCAFICSYLVQ